MVQKTIYFVRHGEAMTNVEGVVQGKGIKDDLTERGREQAETVAERAKYIEFDALVSSDINRAKQTAEVIGRATEKDVEYSKFFRETRLPSSFVGKNHEDEAVHDFLKAERENVATPEWRYEDEENFDDLLERAHEALTFLESHENDRVMVVTHGQFLRFIVSVMLMDRSLTLHAWSYLRDAMKTTNTGITVCTLSSRWRLLTWNDRTHFAE